MKITRNISKYSWHCFPDPVRRESEVGGLLKSLIALTMCLCISFYLEHVSWEQAHIGPACAERIAPISV